MNRIESTVEIIENYCGLGERLVKETGASYVPGRDIKDIAKDIRGLIKKAVKAGYLPKLKASVRIERYSMGSSINVAITEVEACVINVDAWRQQVASNYSKSWSDVGDQHNATGKEILGLVRRFVAAFQRSESHGQSDYHNTNFYSDVAFSHEVKTDQLFRFVENTDDQAV